MTVDEAINIAWTVARLGEAGGTPRPTPEQALAYFETALKSCKFNWITGQNARDVLTEHLYGPMWHCQNCHHEDREVEFEPTDGNPSPHVCPKCGSSGHCFPKD